jgi:hypothetical protein
MSKIQATRTTLSFIKEIVNKLKSILKQKKTLRWLPRLPTFYPGGSVQSVTNPVDMVERKRCMHNELSVAATLLLRSLS